MMRKTGILTLAVGGFLAVASGCSRGDTSKPDAVGSVQSAADGWTILNCIGVGQRTDGDFDFDQEAADLMTNIQACLSFGAPSPSICCMDRVYGFDPSGRRHNTRGVGFCANDLQTAQNGAYKAAAQFGASLSNHHLAKRGNRTCNQVVYLPPPDSNGKGTWNVAGTLARDTLADNGAADPDEVDGIGDPSTPWLAPPPPPPPVCNPGDKQCMDGDVFQQCNDDGGGWTNYSCSASFPGTTCSGGYCVGSPPPSGCNPGDKQCVDGDQFQQCNDDGQTWSTYSCGASWPGTVCSGGYCVGSDPGSSPPPPDPGPSCQCSSDQDCWNLGYSVCADGCNCQ
jgi:hypothetical protein